MFTKADRQLRKQRLNALAAILEVSPDEKFDMTQWRGDKSGKLNTPTTSLKTCGTVSCAFGHAIAAFPQLKLAINAHGRTCVRIREHDEEGDGELFYFFVEAAQTFFRLTTRQADDLFLPDDMDRVSKQEVIKRIRKAAK